MISTGDPISVVRIPKTCARCGMAFGALGREYICPACKMPKPVQAEEAPRRLSFRQQQIVNRVRQGKLNKEIGAELCLSEGTVKEYVRVLFRKYGLRNRTDLAMFRFPEDAQHRETQCLT